MDQRISVLEDRTTLADTVPYTYNLKGLGPMSALDIIIRATNGATSNLGHPPHADITKVEVIDGSKVIHSLSGVEVRALNAIETKRFPPATYLEGAAAVQEEYFTIHFGRFKGDPDYWFDPGQYANPTLKVTGALTLSATVGFATGTGSISVLAHQLTGGGLRRLGTFKATEYDNRTSAASGDVKRELPHDLVHRSILARIFEAGTAYTANVTNWKVSADGDNIVPLNIRSVVAEELAHRAMGRFTLTQQLLRADNDATIPGYLGRIDQADLAALVTLPIAHAKALTAEAITSGLVVVTVVPAISLEATARAIRMRSQGLAPYNTLLLPATDLDNPDKWLDMRKVGKLEVIATDGNAGATVQLFGQQVQP